MSSEDLYIIYKFIGDNEYKAALRYIINCAYKCYKPESLHNLHAQYERLFNPYNYYSISALRSYFDGELEYYKSISDTNPYALVVVGDCYYYGVDTNVDIIQAHKYYELACQKNNGFAYYAIANAHHKKRLYKDAYKFYKLSMDQGIYISESFMDHLKNDIGSEIIDGFVAEKKYIDAFKYGLTEITGSFVIDEPLKLELKNILDKYEYLLKENAELRDKLDYAPGGIGYIEAKKEFEEKAKS